MDKKQTNRNTHIFYLHEYAFKHTMPSYRNNYYDSSIVIQQHLSNISP